MSIILQVFEQIINFSCNYCIEIKKLTNKIDLHKLEKSIVLEFECVFYEQKASLFQSLTKEKRYFCEKKHIQTPDDGFFKKNYL
jgi:hypothetical protein